MNKFSTATSQFQRKNITIFFFLLFPIFSIAQTVGIGSTSFTPLNMLDIKGATVVGSNYAGTNTAPTNGLLVEGNVGIGTTSPASNAQVHIYGSAVTGGTNANVSVGSSMGTANILGTYLNGVSTGYAQFVANATFNGATWSTVNSSYDQWATSMSTTTTNGGGFFILHSVPGATPAWSSYLKINALNGNVGIATTSPGTKLSIAPATAYAAPTLGTASGAFSMLGDDGLYGLYSGVSNTGNVWFQAMRNDANATPYALLLNPSGGNVNIGTTSSLAKLTINSGYLYVGGSPATGVSNNQGAYMGWNYTSGTGETDFINHRGGGTGGFIFYNTADGTTLTQLAYINSSGDVCSASGVFNTCSDIRFKRDIVRVSSALKKINNLTGNYYYWKTDEFADRNFRKTRQLGLIAQELEKEFPELVYEDDKGYKSVDYDHFIPVLLEAIKEQQQQIEALKKQADNQQLIIEKKLLPSETIVIQKVTN